MTLADAGRPAEVTCEVTTLDGRTVRVGSFWMSSGGYGAWGAVLPVPAGQVRSARVIAADGAVVASAQSAPRTHRAGGSPTVRTCRAPRWRPPLPS